MRAREHIRDNFVAGAPISQVPASWFNSVAKFINGLIPGKNVTFEYLGENATAICALPETDETFASDQEITVLTRMDDSGSVGTLYSRRLTFDKCGILRSVGTEEFAGTFVTDV